MKPDILDPVTDTLDVELGKLPGYYHPWMTLCSREWVRVT